MAPSVVLVIRADPRKTHRAVEALRIALGLGAGDNPLTVVLLDHAPLLLAEDIDDVRDADILEKYRPSLQQLQIPFLVPTGALAQYGLDRAFAVREASLPELAILIGKADRVLVF